MVKARFEQFRQARRIHGGTLNMLVASVAVKLARVPIPSRRARERLFRKVYGSKYMALKEEQLQQPLAEFRTLNELFTRGVRPECRPLADAPEQFICPCDCTIQDVGRLKQDTLLTVKGIGYTLDSLLPGMETSQFEDGWFAICFLSPSDCHRVFSPHSATLQEIVHVPGHRLLVHPPYQRKQYPVFSLNERIIMRLETQFGNCILVLVAGWGVGNITHPFDVQLPLSRRRITHAQLETPRLLKRGEWIATFELGSTVILIMQPHDGIVTHVARDEKVNYGNPLVTIPAAESDSISGK